MAQFDELFLNAPKSLHEQGLIVAIEEFLTSLGHDPKNTTVTIKLTPLNFGYSVETN